MLIGMFAKPATSGSVNRMGKVVFLGYGMHCALKGILLPPIISEFSISYTQSGLLLASITVAFLLSVVTFGKFAQKAGQRAAITYNIFGLVLSSLLIVLAHDILVVMFSLILSGWCHGGIECGMTAIVKRYNPERSDIAINSVFSFFCIGSCLSAFMGGYFVYSGFGWRLCYVVVFFISLLGAVFSLFIVDKGENSMPKISFAQLGTVLKNKPFIIGCLAIALFAGIETSTNNWMTTFLTQGSDMNIFKSSNIAALFYASLYVGRIFCGRMLRYYNPRKISIYMCVGGSFIILIVSVINTPGLMWFAIAAFGFMISGLYPLLLSAASSMASEGVVYSVIFMAISFGNILVESTIGVVADVFGIQSTFRFNGILLGLLALFIYINRKNYDRILMGND